MAKKNERLYTILGAAVGTGLAVYGIRQGMRWYQRRQLTHRLDRQIPESSWPAQRRYQPVDQPDREAIPATGPLAAAPPMTGMTAAERVNSDRVGDFDDRGTAFGMTERDRNLAEDIHVDYPIIPDNAYQSTGSEMYGGATESRGTGDAWNSGATGGVSAGGSAASSFGGAGTGGRTGAMRGEETYRSTGGSQNIVMDEYAAPLIEHAIAFNSVMNLLRSRQRSGVGNEGTESLTEGDRSSMRAVLDQMQEHIADVDEAALRGNALAMRSFNLTRKMRDALDNLDYSGSDLFRIYGEVKAELCGLARELENSGQVTITGLDQIRQLYEC